jgi:4-cresol dehydrogenase (hydroxylating)
MTGDRVVAGERFRLACEEFLGPERCRALSPQEHTATGLPPRRIPAVLFPQSLEELQKILGVARACGIALHPVSTGKNWGLGSFVPVRDHTAVLNLSRLRRIREVNLELGYAVVEPGVTQEDLARELERLQAPFYVDVTGAGKSTSLLGNALERGIAYNSQRTRHTRALEILLSDGTLLHTGFQDPRARTLNHLYAHGLGPDMTGLFYQSNFGIVTALTIDLLPRPEAQASVNLNVDTAQLPALMERLRDLMRQGVIQGVPHVGNLERTRSTLSPILLSRAQGRLSRSDIDGMLANLLPRPWSTILSLAGPPSILSAKLTLLRRTLRGLGDLRVMTPGRARWARWLTRRLFPRLHLFLTAAQELNNLGFGEPTDEPQRFLDHETDEGGMGPLRPPDEHPRGFLYVLPLAPLTGEMVRGLVGGIEAAGRAEDLSPAVTLNLLDDKILEAVVSVTFDKSSEEARERAQRFVRDLLSRSAALGAFPYRLHIDHMNEVHSGSEVWTALQHKFKNVCDPHGIFAPGRYQPPGGIFFVEDPVKTT